MLILHFKDMKDLYSIHDLQTKLKVTSCTKRASLREVTTRLKAHGNFGGAAGIYSSGVNIFKQDEYWFYFRNLAFVDGIKAR